jgi:hypothetical protein
VRSVHQGDLGRFHGLGVLEADAFLETLDLSHGRKKALRQPRGQVDFGLP